VKKIENNSGKSWAEIWEDLQNWEIPEPMQPDEWEITPDEWERLQSGWEELADSLNQNYTNGGGAKKDG
jgi:hypothetical protein